MDITQLTKRLIKTKINLVKIKNEILISNSYSDNELYQNYLQNEKTKLENELNRIMDDIRGLVCTQPN